MTKLIDFPRSSPPARPHLVALATSRKLAEALLDRNERARIVTRLVDVSRELGDRQSRAEFWTAILENYRTRCRNEGASTPDIARGLRMLKVDVGLESERRTRMAEELAEIDPLPWAFTPAQPPISATVLSFPAEGPPDEMEARIPKLES